MLADGEVLVELELRRDGEHNEAVTEGVAVLALTVLQDADGVGQTATALKAALQIVVGLGQVVAHRALLVEGVGREEGGLGQTQEARRRDHRGEGIGGCTVVAKATVHIAVGCVEAHVQSAGHLDVGVQSHEETGVVVLLQRAVAERVSHREVVGGGIVATLHVDGIVLREGVLVDFLAPVGLVVILVIIEIGRLGVQVLHLAELVGIHPAHQQLGAVESVVIGSHHLRQGGHQFVAAIDGHVDLGGHRLVALGLDNQHAVGTLGTVEGRSVLQHLHALDVVHAQVGQHIVVVAIVQHIAVVLHIHQHIVDHHQRLGVGIERVDALDEHHITCAGDATAADGADVGP